MRLVLRTEGVSGLYRGITPTLLGIVPYAGLKFYVYQSLKVPASGILRCRCAAQPCAARPGKLGMPGKWLPGSACASDMLAAGTAVDCMAWLKIAPLWLGLGRCTCSAAAQVWYGSPLSSDRPPVPVTLALGAISGLIAQSVTYPLDIVRRQMQAGGPATLQGRGQRGQYCRWCVLLVPGMATDSLHFPPPAVP